MFKKEERLQELEAKSNELYKLYNTPNRDVQKVTESYQELKQLVENTKKEFSKAGVSDEQTAERFWTIEFNVGLYEQRVRLLQQPAAASPAINSPQPAGAVVHGVQAAQAAETLGTKSEINFFEEMDLGKRLQKALEGKANENKEVRDAARALENSKVKA